MRKPPKLEYTRAVTSPLSPEIQDLVLFAVELLNTGKVNGDISDEMLIKSAIDFYDSRHCED